MSLEVSTGKARGADVLLQAFARGRNDPSYFCEFFMGRKLHDGQAEYMLNAEAKINCLATANRWGKTTVLTGRHLHRGTYKIGAEWRYMEPDGSLNLDAFTSLKYETVHTAGEWEQAQYVWQDIQKLIIERQEVQALITDAPKSLPPFVRGLNGWKWMFRTLGHNASGVDGKSIYLLSIDEAGWIDNLDEMMRNVLRVRTADVRGVIDIVGTFKPGISRDFYKIAVRASASTGRSIGFAHQSDDESVASSFESVVNLDSAIKKYLKEFGINLDEYRDALERGLHGRA